MFCNSDLVNVLMRQSKMKISPLLTTKAHGDMDVRVHIYTVTALKEIRWLVLRSAAPGIHFIAG